MPCASLNSLIIKDRLDYESALIYNMGVMEKAHLTKKQEKLLDFIERYQMKHGASPTVREMREYMELKSDGFVVYCVEQLAKKGAIKKGDTPRSIGLMPSVAEKLQTDFVKVPIVGYIPAGGPVVSEENVEGWMSFETGKIRGSKECFILRVIGDSMIDAGIFDGDFVIASAKMQPKAKDIVIALVDGASTVKRYMMDRNKSYLKPENSKYKNIYPEKELEVQGVVIGLFRWY